MKTKTWIRRWGEYDTHGLVDFFHTKRLWPTDSSAQMSYPEFLRLFGIPLEPTKVYSLKIKATAKLSR